VNVRACRLLRKVETISNSSVLCFHFNIPLHEHGCFLLNVGLLFDRKSQSISTLYNFLCIKRGLLVLFDNCYSLLTMTYLLLQFQYYEIEIMKQTE
jgi:hypothetical protein